MITRLLQALAHPAPIQRMIRPLMQRATWLPFELRLEHDAVERPWMGYAVYQAARLAKRLNIPAISVVEMGCASGAGLMILQKNADEIGEALGVRIQVLGFDTGVGLPEPQGFEDAPQLWQKNFYADDGNALQKRLGGRASPRLIIGDVADTIGPSLADEALRHAETGEPAPIAAIIHDLDFFSSTLASFKIFGLLNEFLMPRIFNYFDDLISDPIAGLDEEMGEWLAISRYNQEQRNDGTKKRILQDKFVSMRPRKIRAQWNQQIYIWRNADHPLYSKFVGTPNDQRPLA